MDKLTLKISHTALEDLLYKVISLKAFSRTVNLTITPENLRVKLIMSEIMKMELQKLIRELNIQNDKIKMK